MSERNDTGKGQGFDDVEAVLLRAAEANPYPGYGTLTAMFNEQSQVANAYSAPGLYTAWEASGDLPGLGNATADQHHLF